MISDGIKSIIEEIYNSNSFQRTRGISFLGIVDQPNIGGILPLPVFSRAEHSLGVLKLAILVSDFAQLSEDDTNYLVISSLLHDIGHPPFSHSLEYAYPASDRKWDHHLVLKEILLQPVGKEKDVKRILMRYNFSVDRIFSIINGDDDLSFFLYSPINIDTIDGIQRSIECLGIPHGAVHTGDLLRLTASLYRGDTVRDENLIDAADEFWHLKERFYDHLSSDSLTASLERRFQESVRRNIPELNRYLFRLTEVQFAHQFPQVIRETADSNFDGKLDKSASQTFLVNEQIREFNRDNVVERYRRVKYAAERESH